MTRSDFGSSTEQQIVSVAARSLRSGRREAFLKLLSECYPSPRLGSRRARRTFQTRSKRDYPNATWLS